MGVQRKLRINHRLRVGSIGALTVLGEVREEVEQLAADELLLYGLCKLAQVGCSRAPHHGGLVVAELPEEGAELGLALPRGAGVGGGEELAGGDPVGEPLPGREPLWRAHKGTCRRGLSNSCRTESKVKEQERSRRAGKEQEGRKGA